jgi:hypothetical protein
MSNFENFITEEEVTISHSSNDTHEDETFYDPSDEFATEVTDDNLHSNQTFEATSQKTFEESSKNQSKLDQHIEKHQESNETIETCNEISQNLEVNQEKEFTSKVYPFSNENNNNDDYYNDDNNNDDNPEESCITYYGLDKYTNDWIPTTSTSIDNILVGKVVAIGVITLTATYLLMKVLRK